MRLFKKKDGTKKKFFDTTAGKLVKKADELFLGGIATTLIEEGVNPSSVVKTAAKAIEMRAESGDPEAIHLGTEFKKHELIIAREIREIELQDVKSARSREIELVKLDKFDFMFYLSGVTGLGAFGFMIYVLVFVDLKPGNKELFVHLLGMIEGVALSIFAYYFGSSKGSQEKQKVLNEMKPLARS